MKRFACAVVALAAMAAQTIEALDEREFPSFDMVNAPLILDLLADTGKALSPDGMAAHRHWSALGEGYAISQEKCGVSLYFHDQLLPGLVNMRMESMSASRGEECGGAAAARAALTVKFASAAQAKDFRAAVSARFGPPDSACSSDWRTHWPIRPGVSLRWETYQEDMGVITLFGSDAPDANCAISSASADQLVGAEQMAAFAGRLKREPPPLENQEKMKAWLAAYGVPEDAGLPGCDYVLFMNPAAALSGIARIQALGHEPDCAASKDEVFRHSKARASLVLQDFDTDAFVLDKMRGALTAMFGEPEPSCMGRRAVHWEMTDGMHVRLSGEAGVRLVIDRQPDPEPCG